MIARGGIYVQVSRESQGIQRTEKPFLQWMMREEFLDQNFICCWSKTKAQNTKGRYKYDLLDKGDGFCAQNKWKLAICALTSGAILFWLAWILL